MAKAKLELGKLTITGKIALARQIVGQMTGNTAFATPNPAPTPTLAALTTAAAAAETAYNDAASARLTAQQKTLVQHTRAETLATLLTQLAAYVDTASAGDEKIILSAGMDVRAARSPSKVPPQVQALSATAGAKEGTIDLNWKPTGTKGKGTGGGTGGGLGGGTKCYNIEMSTANGTGPWTLCRTVTKSKTTVGDLTSGQRLWFRVAAVSAAGQGPWSDPATKMVP